MNTRVSIVLTPTDRHAPGAIPSGSTGATGYVDGPGWMIQSSSTAELRRLATALTEAARLADKLALDAA